MNDLEVARGILIALGLSLLLWLIGFTFLFWVLK
jgi:hypothetical protein